MTHIRPFGMHQVLEALYVPLLERHIQNPPKGEEASVQPYSRVLGGCRSFLSAYKRAEEHLQGMQALATNSSLGPLLSCLSCITNSDEPAMLAYPPASLQNVPHKHRCHAEDTHLPMPDLPSVSGNEAPEEEALTKLESALAQWISAIQAALTHEADRVISGKGRPLPHLNILHSRQAASQGSPLFRSICACSGHASDAVTCLA